MKKSLIVLTCTFCLASQTLSVSSIKADDQQSEDPTQSSQHLMDYSDKYGVTNKDEEPLTLKKTRSIGEDYSYVSIFIEFPDVTSVRIDDNATVDAANQVLNDGGMMKTPYGDQNIMSLKNYMKTYSYGNVSLSADVFPKKDGVVKSYIAPYKRGYYLKKTDNNKDGYTTAAEAARREANLIQGAMSVAKSSVESRFTSGELDSNNDGNIDAVTFFVEAPQGNPDVNWSDLLWPHKTQGNSSIKFNGKSLSSYNLITISDPTKAGSILSRQVDSDGDVVIQNADFSVLEHEYLHTWGLPDLYRGYDSGEPVGFYDIMARNVTNPQPMTSVMQRDWLRWGSPINKVYQSQTVTLDKAEFASGSDSRSIKIMSPDRNNEYFVAEYYTPLEGVSDTATAKTNGILFYRINTDYEKPNGNINGNSSNGKDYMYMFRPGESRRSEGLGSLVDAVMSSNEGNAFGKSETSQWDNDTLYYSDGVNSGIVVSVVGETNSTVTMKVDIPRYDPNPITNITLNTNHLQLLPGETRQLSYSILPNDATTDRNVTWESSDESIVQVEDGKIKAMKNGEAVIQVITSNGILDECRVVVKTPITSIAFEEELTSLRDGEREQLTPTILPIGAADSALNWESSDPSIASVSQDGVVTGLYPGSVTITATSTDGPSAQCVVNILPSLDMIILDTNEVLMKPDEDYQLTAKIKYEGLYELDELTWFSLTPEIVSVENGMLHAIANGKATILVKGPEDTMSFCNVIVHTPISDISFETDNVHMDRNETYQPSLIIKPMDASDDYAIEWVSSNEDIATIDNDGIIHSALPGDVVIKAIVTTEFGDTHETSFNLTVDATYVAPTQEQYDQIDDLGEQIDQLLSDYDFKSNHMNALLQIQKDLKAIEDDKSLSDLDVKEKLEDAIKKIEELDAEKIIRKSDDANPVTSSSVNQMQPKQKAQSVIAKTGDTTNIALKTMAFIGSVACLVRFKKRK